MPLVLRYDRGTLAISGSYGTPFSVWDERSKVFRAPAYRHKDVVEFLRRSKVDFVDQVMNPLPVEYLEKRVDIELREYQAEALDSWESAGRRGVIVLPTGSGKTILAMEAMLRLQCSTLVVVPTIPLLNQWRSELKRYLGIDAGALGGGHHELKGVTVSTYDSAYLRAEELGDKYEFAVFDETHHLAAEGYSQIGEMLAARNRLGLTATFEREDGAHVRLFSLIGGVVYRLSPKQLAGEHLAEFHVIRIPVSLKEEEKTTYDRLMEDYRSYLRETGLEMRSLGDFKRLIIRSGVSLEARKALLARNKARKVALNSSSKLEALSEILRAHSRDKVIVFTEYNEMAERISSTFLMPVLTHKTPPRERDEVLGGFRTGTYTKIATSKVLDEGLDVPDARVAVVVGGSGSRREFIQRLGRILRKKERTAVLYEVVSKGTVETRVSRRRREALRG